MTATIPLAWLGVNDSISNAILILLLTAIAAVVIKRTFQYRSERFAQAVVRGELSPESVTRLRFIERLIFAAIIALGIMVALTQFSEVKSLAQVILTSTAILAAAVGLAARQTLSNIIAGITLAITQPIRVGDWITFEEHYGVVEDVRLTYTRLRTASDRNVMIPNEKLAAGTLLNDTLGSDHVALEVNITMPIACNTDLAIDLLERETNTKVGVADVTSEGVTLSLRGKPCSPTERNKIASSIRIDALRHLRSQGLIVDEPA